jgi:hypothetical protein
MVAYRSGREADRSLLTVHTLKRQQISTDPPYVFLSHCLLNTRTTFSMTPFFVQSPATNIYVHNAELCIFSAFALVTFRA